MLFQLSVLWFELLRIESLQSVKVIDDGYMLLKSSVIWFEFLQIEILQSALLEISSFDDCVFVQTESTRLWIRRSRTLIQKTNISRIITMLVLIINYSRH